MNEALQLLCAQTIGEAKTRSLVKYVLAEWLRQTRRAHELDNGLRYRNRAGAIVSFCYACGMVSESGKDAILKWIANGFKNGGA